MITLYTHMDSLKSGNITGQYQMSPEISMKKGTFDNDRGTNDIAQGHLIVTSQYQLSQRDVLRTFYIDWSLSIVPNGVGTHDNLNGHKYGSSLPLCVGDI